LEELFFQGAVFDDVVDNGLDEPDLFGVQIMIIQKFGKGQAPEKLLYCGFFPRKEKLDAI